MQVIYKNRFNVNLTVYFLARLDSLLLNEKSILVEGP